MNFITKRQYRSLDYVFLEVRINKEHNQHERIHIKRINSIWSVTIIPLSELIKDKKYY